MESVVKMQSDTTDGISVANMRRLEYEIKQYKQKWIELIEMIKKNENRYSFLQVLRRSEIEDEDVEYSMRMDELALKVFIHFQIFGDGGNKYNSVIKRSTEKGQENLKKRVVENLILSRSIFLMNMSRDDF